MDTFENWNGSEFGCKPEGSSIAGYHQSSYPKGALFFSTSRWCCDIFPPFGDHLCSKIAENEMTFLSWFLFFKAQQAHAFLCRWKCIVGVLRTASLPSGISPAPEFSSANWVCSNIFWCISAWKMPFTLVWLLKSVSKYRRGQAGEESFSLFLNTHKHTDIQLYLVTVDT